MKLELLNQVRDKIPNEKAISVADGMAQPFNVSDFQNLLQYKIEQGLPFHQLAAIIGSKAFLN